MSLVWTLGFFGVGIICGVLVVWSRRGRSSAARWWVRPDSIDSFGRPFWYNESLALLVLPYLAQLALVAGLLTLPGVPDGIRATGLVAETAIGCAVLPFGYRTVLPVHVYPPWLRAERARDREWLRASRGARPQR